MVTENNVTVYWHSEANATQYLLTVSRTGAILHVPAVVGASMSDDDGCMWKVISDLCWGGHYNIALKRNDSEQAEVFSCNFTIGRFVTVMYMQII